MKVAAFSLATLCSLAIATVLLLLADPPVPQPQVGENASEQHLAEGDEQATSAAPEPGTVVAPRTKSEVPADIAGEPKPASQQTTLETQPTLTTVTERYESGALRERYFAVRQSLQCDLGEISEFKVSETKCLLLVATTADPPLRGATVSVNVVGYGARVLKAKVAVHYHVDDDPQNAVEQIGLAIDLTPESRAILLPQGKLRQGAYEAWYEDGTRAARGTFERGSETGEWTYWYADGRLRGRGAYVKGQPSGSWTLWHPNGAQWCACEFSLESRTDTTWQVWTDAGSVDGRASDSAVQLFRRVWRAAELRRYTEALESTTSLEEQLGVMVESDRKDRCMSLVHQLRTGLTALANPETEADAKRATQTAVSDTCKELRAPLLSNRAELPLSIFPRND